MALGLNRIWVRFGLGITAAVMVTIGALALGKSCKTPRSVWYMSACNGILTGHEAKQP